VREALALRWLLLLLPLLLQLLLFHRAPPLRATHAHWERHQGTQVQQVWWRQPET
jgi:hypothetical protein